jgi:hypothetical protein
MQGSVDEQSSDLIMEGSMSATRLARSRVNADDYVSEHFPPVLVMFAFHE